jgi:ATPase family associated with various cellular activities (AAA)/Winged helix domain, variant
MAAADDWSEANKAYLVAAISEVKTRLRQHADAPADRTQMAARAPSPDMAGAAFENRPPALEVLVRGFGLSDFERLLLLLCAGIELDPEFAPLCASAQGDPARRQPTFGLGLAALPEPHWSALAPNAPLRRWRLVELSPGPPLTAAPLRIDERVLHYLAGVAQLDERLVGMLRPPPPGAGQDLPRSHSALADSVAGALSAAASSFAAPIVQLSGDLRDTLPIAAAAARLCGLGSAIMAADFAPAGASELDAFVNLWRRESVLAGMGLLVIEAEASGEEAGSRGRNLDRLIDCLGGLVVVCERLGRRLGHRPAVLAEVRHPLPQEQREAWERALAGAAASRIDAIAAQFSLSLPAIQEIAGEARARLGHRDDSAADRLAETAWELCRTRLRTGLEGLAQRVVSEAGWDQLVLPPAQAALLHSIAAQLRQRITVYERWGFGARSRRGLGVSALFFGQSGTGKTLAAEVLANELRLDLYRIDLSSVVSKYIGETEANLRRVFDAAEESGAILLFDEADALFGKRSEVKDSHDRYANIEVSYLLQRMESYRGLAILTTNMKSALDPAFLRRIRFIVEFPFPDEAERAAIWRRIFPPEAPLDGVDWGRLAALRIAGGNIRNIALNAAFLAADAGEPVRMTHLMAATRGEYAKLERPLTAAELGG